MKHLIIAAAIGMALSAVQQQNATAQDFAGRWAIQPVIGMTIPHSEFGNGLDKGLQWGVKLRRNLCNHYSTDLSWLYTKHNYSDVDADLSLVQLTWDHILYFTASKIKPCIGAGLGLYRIGSIPAAGVQDTSENTFGVNIGIGVEFLTSERASLLLDVYRYHFSTKADKLGEIGVRASTVGVGLNIYLN